VGHVGDPEMPSLLELDRFSTGSLRKWAESARSLDELHASLHFDLEPLRQRDGQKLLDAIRSRASMDLPFQGWSRIVDYQFTLDPLSLAGSLRNVGGRFNMGSEISPATITPFPALYIAENFETALREKFGQSQSMTHEFSSTDLALRTAESFSQVRLRGRLDLVIDVCDPAALEPFAKVIRGFPIPRNAQLISRRLGFKRPPWLIRSSNALQRQLLHRNWRVMPVQFALPSNSQIFGRLASAAGMHGILYPSAQNADSKCLALFPQNWNGTTSFVEIEGTVPAEIVRARLDGGLGSSH
jgi:RES domain-containing protein